MRTENEELEDVVDEMNERNYDIREDRQYLRMLENIGICVL